MNTLPNDECFTEDAYYRALEFMKKHNEVISETPIDEPFNPFNI